MKETIFVSGQFRFVHAGHVRLFAYAKTLAKRLIVGVLDEGLGRDRVSDTAVRVEALRTNVYVDDVVVIDELPVKTIDQLKPDLVIKGKEFENTFNPEQAIVDQYGGKLLFSPGNFDIYSFDSIQDLDDLSDLARIRDHARPFMDRHDITFARIRDLITKFQSQKILVLGDTIVDEYQECKALGMSREDSVVVLKPIGQQKFLGGAAIVACHAASLGADVCFLSMVGSDEPAEFVKKNNVK